MIPRFLHTFNHMCNGLEKFFRCGLIVATDNYKVF